MSARVDQRIKGKLNVDIHACDLCVYTLKITANNKTFTPTQEGLTQKIREAAIEIPRAHVDESYRAWRSHAMKGNNYKTIKRMDRYYKSLWEERSDDGSSQEKNDLGERTGED